MLSTLEVMISRFKLAVIKLFMKLTPQPKPVAWIGPDSSLQLCKTISQFGLKKVLIITDKPLLELGLIDPVQQVLTELGVGFASTCFQKVDWPDADRIPGSINRNLFKPVAVALPAYGRNCPPISPFCSSFRQGEIAKVNPQQ